MDISDDTKDLAVLNVYWNKLKKKKNIDKIKIYMWQSTGNAKLPSRIWRQFKQFSVLMLQIYVFKQHHCRNNLYSNINHFIINLCKYVINKVYIKISYEDFIIIKDSEVLLFALPKVPSLPWIPIDIWISIDINNGILPFGHK